MSCDTQLWKAANLPRIGCPEFVWPPGRQLTSALIAVLFVKAIILTRRKSLADSQAESAADPTLPMNATKCPSPTIRVYLLSDYLILASALIQLIDKGAPLFELCGGAIGCEEALEDPGLSIADVVLIDMETGGDVARDIIPRLSKISDAKVLLLTRMNDLDAQDRAVLAGARGVIRQNTPPDLLLTALAKVHEGQMWLDREATSRIFVEFSRRNSGKKPLQGNERHKAMLTSREEKVIACIVENGEATGKVIADKLHISESTLRNHLTSIYSKLGISNRVGLLNYAQKNGLGK